MIILSWLLALVRLVWGSSHIRRSLSEGDDIVIYPIYQLRPTEIKLVGLTENNRHSRNSDLPSQHLPSIAFPAQTSFYLISVPHTKS